MPRLKVMLNEKESAPQLCHQHEDAPCTTVCPINAINRVDGAVQSDESLYVNCKLCGVAYLLGVIKSSGSRSLHIPANANTPKASPAPSAPARVSPLSGWVPGVCAIAVKCDLCSFDEQGPVCVCVCPTKVLYLVNNMDTARANKRRRELTFNTDFGDLTLSQQVQSGDTK